MIDDGVIHGRMPKPLLTNEVPAQADAIPVVQTQMPAYGHPVLTSKVMTPQNVLPTPSAQEWPSVWANKQGQALTGTFVASDEGVGEIKTEDQAVYGVIGQAGYPTVAAAADIAGPEVLSPWLPPNQSQHALSTTASSVMDHERDKGRPNVHPSDLYDPDVPLDSQRTPQDMAAAGSMRPQAFCDFIGQKQHVDNLHVFIQAACARQEALDHLLLHGPAGLGKTTLALLTAKAMASTLKISAGPVLTKPGDLAAILTQLGPRDILFIDEIHRLPIQVEEILYSAMEDYRIDIMLGEGPHARALSLTLPPFTLIGATTRVGLLSSPLRDRFGIMLPLTFYTRDELARIVHSAAYRMAVALSDQAAYALAARARGTPRVALRLLRRVRDFAQVTSHHPILTSDHIPSPMKPVLTLNVDHVQDSLAHLGMTHDGLDPVDQAYLKALEEIFNGGPVGIDTIAACLAQDKQTIEDWVEPYLLQQGLLQRTPRGRQLTPAGRQRTCSLEA